MSLTWAVITLAATLLKPVDSTPRELPAPVYPMATPSQVTNSLYVELSRILDRPRLDPQPIVSPMWWNHLSRRTTALHEGIRRLDAEDGVRTISYDWLCQCRYRNRFSVPPKIVVEKSGKGFAELTVRFNGSGGSTQLSLYYVWEDGWKLDDIVTEDSQRFTDALKQGIRNHALNRKPLPDSRQP